MADTTLDNPDQGGSGKEPINAGDELPVKIATLEADGNQPEIGDEVTVEVKGTVSRIRDDCAYVTVETVNDEPIENPAEQPEDKAMNEDQLMQMSQQADQQGSSPYG